jgi:hypothetical protein
MRVRTPRIIRTPGALLIAGALAVLPSCDLGLQNLTNPCGRGGCPIPGPQDCAALSRTSWRVSFLNRELENVETVLRAHARRNDHHFTP